MTRIFGSAHRYFQGPDAIEHLGTILAPFGPTVLVIVDSLVREMIGGRVDALLARDGVESVVRTFIGEITYPAIQALANSMTGSVPSIVVGIGGGKALDAAKGVCKLLDRPVVTVPTIASNDSPTSSLIAMYDSDHALIAVDRLARSPEAVIVDTALIARAPIRFLRAGIGDAISKKFEAEACWHGTGSTPFGTRPTRTAIAIADACYRTIRAHGAAALAAAQAGNLTEDLEATIEAVILMSGLGFENGGLSLAHSLTRGLVKARGARDAIHGEHVAWGLLVQLAAEGRSSAEMRDALDLHRRLGLPVSLGALGMPDPTVEEIAEIAKWTMTAPHLANLPVRVDQDGICRAIQAIENLAAASSTGA